MLGSSITPLCCGGSVLSHAGWGGPVMCSSAEGLTNTSVGGVLGIGVCMCGSVGTTLHCFGVRQAVHYCRSALELSRLCCVVCWSGCAILQWLKRRVVMDATSVASRRVRVIGADVQLLLVIGWDRCGSEGPYDVHDWCCVRHVGSRCCTCSSSGSGGGRRPRLDEMHFA